MGGGGELPPEAEGEGRVQRAQPAAWHQADCQHQRVNRATLRLPYNPITLEYDRNPEGEKLKRMDEDTKIRGYVRAHNMDHNGNSKYNPLTG